MGQHYNLKCNAGVVLTSVIIKARKENQIFIEIPLLFFQCQEIDVFKDGLLETGDE